MHEVKPKDIEPRADNIVITCMDNRIHKATRHLLMSECDFDIDEAVRLIASGASKAVSDGRLMPDIKLARELQGIKTVWIVDHTDCGGFGKLSAFGGDEQKEIIAHYGSLAQASETVHKDLPELDVKGFVVTQDGQLLAP